MVNLNTISVVSVLVCRYINLSHYVECIACFTCRYVFEGFSLFWCFCIWFAFRVHTLYICILLQKIQACRYLVLIHCAEILFVSLVGMCLKGIFYFDIFVCDLLSGFISKMRDVFWFQYVDEGCCVILIFLYMICFHGSYLIWSNVREMFMVQFCFM